MTQPVVPNLVSGSWNRSGGGAIYPGTQPLYWRRYFQDPLCGGREVDDAVKAAQKAFASWSKTPPPKRATVLFNYRQLLEAHFDELSRIIVQENGKTLEEARGDVRRGLEVVELACGIGHLAKGENLPRIAEGVDGVTMREPIGVCAGITPFNFPAMVPMWMFPLAIACGNAFILKPSEKVPLTANRLGELLLAAGLPEGVFNIVQGGRDVVEAICTHPGIAAVSFVGSSLSTCTRPAPDTANGCSRPAARRTCFWLFRMRRRRQRSARSWVPRSVVPANDAWLARC